MPCESGVRYVVTERVKGRRCERHAGALEQPGYIGLHEDRVGWSRDDSDVSADPGRVQGAVLLLVSFASMYTEKSSPATTVDGASTKNPECEILYTTSIVSIEGVTDVSVVLSSALIMRVGTGVERAKELPKPRLSTTDTSVTP